MGLAAAVPLVLQERGASYRWFMCVTWLIHVCDMTHSCVWHDSFMCVTCITYIYTCVRDTYIYTCVITYIYTCVMAHSNVTCHVWMSHVTYEWVMSRMFLPLSWLFLLKISVISTRALSLSLSLFLFLSLSLSLLAHSRFSLSLSLSHTHTHTHIHTHTHSFFLPFTLFHKQTHSHTQWARHIFTMGWLRLVGSLKS